MADVMKEREARLRDSEARYRQLYDSVSDLIYTQDLEGRFLSATRAMSRLFGFEPEDFIGRRAADFMKPELRPLFDTEYLTALKARGRHEGISAYYAKDGRKIYVEYISTLSIHIRIT